MIGKITVTSSYEFNCHHCPEVKHFKTYEESVSAGWTERGLVVYCPSCSKLPEENKDSWATSEPMNQVRTEDELREHRFNVAVSNVPADGPASLWEQPLGPPCACCGQLLGCYCFEFPHTDKPGVCPGLECMEKNRLENYLMAHGFDGEEERCITTREALIIIRRELEAFAEKVAPYMKDGEYDPGETQYGSGYGDVYRIPDGWYSPTADAIIEQRMY